MNQVTGLVFKLSVKIQLSKGSIISIRVHFSLRYNCMYSNLSKYIKVQKINYSHPNQRCICTNSCKRAVKHQHTTKCMPHITFGGRDSSRVSNFIPISYFPQRRRLATPKRISPLKNLCMLPFPIFVIQFFLFTFSYS